QVRSHPDGQRDPRRPALPMAVRQRAVRPLDGGASGGPPAELGRRDRGGFRAAYPEAATPRGRGAPAAPRGLEPGREGPARLALPTRDGGDTGEGAGG